MSVAAGKVPIRLNLAWMLRPRRPRTVSRLWLVLEAMSPSAARLEAMGASRIEARMSFQLGGRFHIIMRGSGCFDTAVESDALHPGFTIGLWRAVVVPLCAVGRGGDGWSGGFPGLQIVA